LKRPSTAIGFLFFIFDLEYLIRVQSSEPLHAKINPISCLSGSQFAFAPTAIFSAEPLQKCGRDGTSFRVKGGFLNDAIGSMKRVP
jgi:hypothetical protein